MSSIVHYMWLVLTAILINDYRRVGAGHVFPAGSPFETQTMMFPIVFPGPRTSASFGAGLPPCFS